MDVHVYLLVIHLCLFKFCFTLHFTGEDIDIVKLQNDVETKVVNFADDLLKFFSLENTYNLTKTSQHEKRNNNDVLKDIAISLMKRLKKGEEIVRNNKKTIETKLYQNGVLHNFTRPCCIESSDKTTFSQMFMGNIIEEMCYIGPKKVYSYSDLSEYFKQNARDLDVLLWQYFGSSDRSFLQYPTEQKTNCDTGQQKNHRFE